MITLRVPLSAMGAGLLVLSVLLTGSEVQGSPLFESANQSLLIAPKDQNDKNDNSSKNNSGGKNDDRSGSSPGSEKKENQTPSQDKGSKLGPVDTGTSSQSAGPKPSERAISPGQERKESLLSTPVAYPSPGATPPAGGNPAQQGIHRADGICHYTGNPGAPYNFLLADDNSAVYRGHLGHPGDIIPASPELCEQKNQDAKATPTTTVPAQAATVTPFPTATTPTVPATATAEPTVVPPAPDPTGTPTTVTRDNSEDTTDGGGEDSEDGDQGSTTGGVLGSEFQLSTGGSPASGAEAGVGPGVGSVGGLVIDPVTGEVLAGEPGVPPRRPGQTGMVPSVSQATARTFVAQIPQTASGSPQVLPSTGESGSSRYQDWGIAGMAMGGLGLTLLRLGRRGEEQA